MRSADVTANCDRGLRWNTFAQSRRAADGFSARAAGLTHLQRALWWRQVEVQLRAPGQPPVFIGGRHVGASLRGLRSTPDTSERHLGIAGLHPNGNEAAGSQHKKDFVHHGSSSCSPHPGPRAGARRARQRRLGTRTVGSGRPLSPCRLVS
jgi:hypothetical protein